MATSQSKLTAAILIISETASKDPFTDKCIPALSQVFSDLGASNWTISTTNIIPDSIPAIQDAVLKACDQGVNLIITSGGTGFAVKDVTPEAVSPLIEKQAPGLVHGMLASSLQVTPFAVMSRPVAGVRGQSLILTLPGIMLVCRLVGAIRDRCIRVVLRSWRRRRVWLVGRRVGGIRMDMVMVIMVMVIVMDVDAIMAMAVITVLRLTLHPKTDRSNLTILLKDLAGDTDTRHTLCSLSRTRSSKLDVTAPESVPAFRASIVDGYAVIAGPDAPTTKGTFPVAMISHAQAGDHQELQPGQIARITTGAPLPPGATSVVMVEDTVLVSKTDDGTEEKEVEILTSEIEVGENVREVGSDVQSGDVIMQKGEGISVIGGEFGLLASVGVKQVSVYKKPVVGVLSTGDEIVNHDREGELKRGEVRDTNRPTLLTAIRGSGFEAVDLGIVSDKPGALEQTLRDATRKVDVIITSGGVSMGELDLLKPTLERQLGGSIHFGRVAMKPGKPTTFATIPVKANDGSRVDKMEMSSSTSKETSSTVQ
ncbi:hypothetical protein KCU77_g74, partial [Aureobasidium melanogenum]